MKVCIVIPTFNEAQNLEGLVEKIFSLHSSFHIIVVDDNSPDGTGRIADALSEKYTGLRVIHRQCKSGLGTAYVEGFKLALRESADRIIEMDADFSHDPIYIADLLRASKTADLVIGSRYIHGVRVEGWRFRRLLMSKLANIFVSYILVKPVWDFTAGFRCYRRDQILYPQQTLEIFSSRGLKGIIQGGTYPQPNFVPQLRLYCSHPLKDFLVFCNRKPGNWKLTGLTANGLHPYKRQNGHCWHP